eukprot:SAG31_NODE_13087_length_893_cov_1.871537_2_plen_182_part_00
MEFDMKCLQAELAEVGRQHAALEMELQQERQQHNKIAETTAISKHREAELERRLIEAQRASESAMADAKDAWERVAVAEKQRERSDEAAHAAEVNVATEIATANQSRLVAESAAKVAIAEKDAAQALLVKLRGKTHAKGSLTHLGGSILSASASRGGREEVPISRPLQPLRTDIDEDGTWD